MDSLTLSRRSGEPAVTVLLHIAPMTKILCGDKSPAAKKTNKQKEQPIILRANTEIIPDLLRF